MNWIDYLTNDRILAERYTENKVYLPHEVIYTSAILDTQSTPFFSFILAGFAQLEIWQCNRWEPVEIWETEDFGGFEHLTMAENYSYRLVTLTKVEVLEVEKDYFLDHMYADPHHLETMINQLFQKYMAMLQQRHVNESNPELSLMQCLVRLINHSETGSHYSIGWFRFPHGITLGKIARIYHFPYQELTSLKKRWRQEEFFKEEYVLEINYRALRRELDFSKTRKFYHNHAVSKNK